MLKPLKKIFQRRASSLSGERDRQELAQAAVRAFLAEAIPEVGSSAVRAVSYDQERRCVSITAEHKAVANEISLRARELLEQLRRAGIDAERLMVR